MLYKMKSIVDAVRFTAKFNNGIATGNQIANIAYTTTSRATVYRHLEKAKNMGLIKCETHAWGNNWALTDKGEEFLGAWHELPF